MKLTTSLLLLTLCCGCNRTAVVKYWEPAQIEVSQLKRVAVLDFSGEQGSTLADNLSRQLGENQFTAIVDRSEVSSEIQMASFAPGEQASLSRVLRRARGQDIDGLLLGEIVTYSCEDSVQRRTDVHILGNSENEDLSYRVFGAGFGLQNSEKLVRQATVSINFRLMAVNSEEILATRTVSHSLRYERVANQPEFPEEQETLQHLAQSCLDEIVTLLAPHEADAEIELAHGDGWNRTRLDIKQGVMHAQAGNWNSAEQEWRKALERNPRNHAALFNLAVAAAQQQDYVAAEDLAMQALRVQYRSAYVAGLESIRARRDRFAKSRDQREGRVEPQTLAEMASE